MLPAPGRTVRLSLAQRFLDDLTRCARGVPVMTLGRRMRLTAAAEARRRAGGRPGWCALFTKAFALVAARRPGLRRAYLPCPRPRLYEHPFSVAAVAVPRAA